MSEGATMSAPARTWLTEESASSFSVGSFCTSLCLMTPQCPWDVYSHRQTSVTRRKVAHILADRAKRLLNDAVVVVGVGADFVLLFRKPKKKKAGNACLFRLSRDLCGVIHRKIELPGIEPISLRTFSPGQTKIG